MAKSEERKPLISVIVPVYNTERYLMDCLNSICRQTYCNLEIIAVNDGSTDGSEKILYQYCQQDTRVHVVNQENEGLSAARNTGLACANGEYVLFVDSDDWIDDCTCEEAIRAIKSTDTDVVMWSYVREYPSVSKPVYLFGPTAHIWNETDIALLYQQFIGLQGEQLKEPQKVDSIVTAWGKLYRKSILEGVQFVDTKIIGTEDALFNIQVFSRVQRAVYIPNLFSHYRKTNTESLTRKYKDQLVYQWKELYNRIKVHLDEEDAPPECYQALNNRIALGLIGLGLNLAEDDRMNFLKKKHEIDKIVHLPHYQEALKALPNRYFPLHWRMFFSCAEHGWTVFVVILLMIMNRMRGH